MSSDQVYKLSCLGPLGFQRIVHIFSILFVVSFWMPGQVARTCSCVSFLFDMLCMLDPDRHFCSYF